MGDITNLIRIQAQPIWEISDENGWLRHRQDRMAFCADQTAERANHDLAGVHAAEHQEAPQMVLSIKAGSSHSWPGPSVRPVAAPLVRLLCGMLLVFVVATGLGRWSPAAEPMPLEFTRMVAHWSDYGHADYLSFIEEARPEIVQVGFYGAHFWSLAHTPQYNGYPVNFPLQGLDELGDWFADLNGKLHGTAPRSSVTSTWSFWSAIPTVRRVRGASSSSIAICGTRTC